MARMFGTDASAASPMVLYSMWNWLTSWAVRRLSISDGK